MARCRNLKPRFFTNDKLAQVHPLGRLLFAGLWCYADRDGRLEYRPKRFKAEILPYDNCNVDRLLEQLATLGFVRIYQTITGEKYIDIPKFSEHQYPNVREPESTIPAYDESCTGTVLVQTQDRTSSSSRAPTSEPLAFDLDSSEPLNCITSEPLNGIAVAAPARKKHVQTVQPGTAEVWSSYSNAYQVRYGVLPSRNARVNSQIKQLCQRIPVDEAPLVAAFYVKHNGDWYVKKLHSVGNLLADAEALRTQWFNGRQVTNRDARDYDNTQGAINLAEDVKRTFRERDEKNAVAG